MPDFPRDVPLPFLTFLSSLPATCATAFSGRKCLADPGGGSWTRERSTSTCPCTKETCRKRWGHIQQALQYMCYFAGVAVDPPCWALCSVRSALVLAPVLNITGKVSLIGRRSVGDIMALVVDSRVSDCSLVHAPACLWYRLRFFLHSRRRGRAAGRTRTRRRSERYLPFLFCESVRQNLPIPRK